MEISRRWLEWELYRERIREEKEIGSLSGVSGVCYETVAACAITALSTLTILSGKNPYKRLCRQIYLFSYKVLLYFNFNVLSLAHGIIQVLYLA